MRKLALLAALLVSSAVFAQPGQTPPNQPSPQPNPVPVKDGSPTAPGLGQQRAPNPIQLTADEKKELADVEAEYERFTAAATQHDARMRAIAKREYDGRTGELDKRYAERIAKTETDRAKRHADTMAQLEKFLATHKNHDQFTPDAMFRLATLYLDQADEEVEARLVAQEKSGNAPGAPDQAAIIADYSKSTDLWQDILTRFPNYRQTPSTMYLLGYYGKYKDERKSLQVFLALACANKYKWNDTPSPIPTRKEALKRADSKTLRDPYAGCQPYQGSDVELVRHAWVRGVADNQFTVPGELDEAISAYLKVADGGNESKLYAESLYKLAWSYYKRDFLLDAIKRFDSSVKLYDSIVAAQNQPPLELRDESIQYIAVAFTDPWPGETDTDPVKAFKRAQDFYKGHENEPHVRDVWVAMGKAFSELQAWDQAVDAYRIAIGPPWELDPHNPLVHQEIVNAFESKGDKYAADAAAAELATRYAPGTAWYAANEKDREAMESQRRIAERALYAATRNTHSAATQMRKDWEASAKKDASQKQEYLAMYGKSVDLYRQFIKTYQDSDYVYEFQFLEGEALYWSERYPEAIEQYKWVRDHKDLGTAYYIDAARSVTQSYEKLAEIEVAAGRLAALKVPTAAELRAMPQPLTPQPIPPIYVQLQAEWDNYQNVIPDPKAAPGQGMNAALVSLAYLHLDDAISRFRKVMDKFCGLPEAVRAKDGMLAIYEATDQNDQFVATNAAFINQKCGDEKAVKDAVVQNTAIQLKVADGLFRDKKFADAANGYYKFYKTAPNDDKGQPNKDLPVALYNTAVAEMYAEHPKTAIQLFKEFTQNTTKPFKESPFYLDAVRLTAKSYQSAFDYDNAVKTYLDLFDLTKKAKRLGIKPPDPLQGEKPQTLDEIGLNALYNAAFAAELNRNFKQAVDLYTQYQGVEKDRRKQDRAQWSIAGIYRQSGDVIAMVDAFDRWRSRYGRDAGNEDDFVQSYYDTSKAWQRKGRTPQAKAAATDAINAWKSHGAIKKSRGAKLAAEFALGNAEEHYDKTWAPFEIKTAAGGGTVAAAKRAIEAQNAEVEKRRKAVEDQYIALDQFGVLEASMAAKVRFGDIQYDRAQKIANIPVPKLIENNDEARAQYETKRDEALKKDLNEAKRDWQEVSDAAKQGGIANKWSDHALENLAREFPDEFHTIRAPIVQGTDAP